MFFPVFLVAILSAVLRVAAVTASDLPDCAVECYLNANQKVGLQLEDYEGRCRSAPFQFAMRLCAAKECDHEEYIFVFLLPTYDANSRLRKKLRNIVRRTSAWISRMS
jgi:hypothetical protein